MSISWNEIKQRAIQFGQDWKNESREDAEAQTFWNDFFNVFGVRRRIVATFEEPVRNIKGTYSYIDLFWKGKLLAEHKSAGKDLSKAQSQAFQYIQELKNAGRDEEIPRYVILSDFRRIALFDLEAAESPAAPQFTIGLGEFHRHIHRFAFIAGYTSHSFEREDPANIKAAELMGALHDALEDSGYTGHALERFLVRVLFCLFADDTGIFEPRTFHTLLEGTKADGGDTGTLLAQIFELLDTPKEKWQKHLDETFSGLEYVNGGLFQERLPIACFNGQMRGVLMQCSHFDWSRISPAIFGALFQSIMQPRQRRQIGAHYTQERDILKVIGSLFLDELKAEFGRIRNFRKNRNSVERFHEKLGALRFFDPACGCGNFLVITYRELRLLEIEVLQALYNDPSGRRELVTDIWHLSMINVDQMYGIEVEEWPARIAEVALWLMDHQMNLKLSEAFGQYFARLPLNKAPKIVQGNALRTDWAKVLDPKECSYILSNPPFIGSKFLNEIQREDMRRICGGVKNSGVLDYVTAWYFKASEYVRDTAIRVGYVSTNSISQGEQPGILWNELYQRGMKIHFAHRTFAWESEARGKAHVHVVIVGFGARDSEKKQIFDYEDGDGNRAAMTEVRNIGPYLLEGDDIAILNRSTPLCDAPRMGIGNKPIDNGNYLFTEEEKEKFLLREPAAGKYFHPWIGSEEFINGKRRWCLWLGKCPPQELRAMPNAMARVDAVRNFRQASKSGPTQELSNTPTRFHVENMPAGNFLVIPEISSERRRYIPIGFICNPTLCSNLLKLVPDASIYHFGILTSAMHMAWVRQTCGRLKSDYRYSSGIVYNNFPWPEAPAEKQKNAVEKAAQKVLAVRDHYTGATLGDLYDPLSMPPDLVKAHQALDRAVDACYRPQAFATERQRVEFLFALYEKYVSPLLALEPKRKRRGRVE